MTWSVCLKIQGYVTPEWSKTLWYFDFYINEKYRSYWVFFVELLFLSIASIISAIQTCMLKTNEDNRFNFSHRIFR